MPTVSSSTIARIPDRALRARYASRLSDYVWQSSADLNLLMEAFSVTELVQRAKAGGAELAAAMAAASTDTEFLEALFSKDRRVTVRAAVAGNEHTRLETTKRALQLALPDRRRMILESLSAKRLLELMSDSDTRLTVLHHGSRISRSQLLDGLLETPAAHWPRYLGEADDAARALQFLPWSELPGQLARELCLVFAWPADQRDSSISNAREMLSRRAVEDGDLEAAMDIQQRTAWHELAQTIVLSATANNIEVQGWDRLEISDTVRDAAARTLLNSRAHLGESLLLRILDIPEGTWVESRSIAHGRTMDDQAVRALMSNLDGDWDSRHVRLGMEALAHANPEAVTNLLNNCPEDYLRRLTSPRDPRMNNLHSVRVEELLGAADKWPVPAVNWLLNLISGHRRHSALDGDPRVARALHRAASGLCASAARAGQIREWAATLTTAAHVKTLARQMNGQGISADAKAVLVYAAWWTQAGPEHDSLRRKILTSLECDESFWRDQVNRPIQEPSMLENTGPGMAAWIEAKAPQALSYLTSLLTGARRRSELYPLLSALAPHYAENWDHEHSLWVAPISNYLSEQLRTSQEWEIAVGLLPEWSGSASELAKVAQSLAMSDH